MEDGTRRSEHKNNLKHLMGESNRQGLALQEILQKLPALDAKYDYVVTSCHLPHLSVR